MSIKNAWIGCLVGAFLMACVPSVAAAAVKPPGNPRYLTTCPGKQCFIYFDRTASRLALVVPWTQANVENICAGAKGHVPRCQAAVRHLAPALGLAAYKWRLPVGGIRYCLRIHFYDNTKATTRIDNHGHPVMRRNCY